MLLRSALEHGFEYTVELAWKVLKGFLEHSGAQLTSVTPKSVVKVAFGSRLLADGQLWIDMLDHRNALSHKYDPTLLGPGLGAIQVRYLPPLEALERYLREQPE